MSPTLPSLSPKTHRTTAVAFLYFVENPHIEKTYNVLSDSGIKNQEILRLYIRRDLIVFKNFGKNSSSKPNFFILNQPSKDFFRSTDLLSVVIILYAVLLALVIGPANEGWKLNFYVG